MNPYDDAEKRPAVRYEDLQIYVDDENVIRKRIRPPRPVSLGYTSTPGISRGLFWWVAIALVIVAAFAIAALILAAPRVAATGPHPGDRRPLPTALFRDVLPDTATDISGKASWYCGPNSRCTRGYPAGGYYAAAGQALRTGDWRGRTVTVCTADSGPRCVRVKLIDWCLCGSGRVIDLYRSAFAQLAPPSRGTIRVTIGRVAVPIGTVPPTDTEPIGGGA